ncbi:efflux RND transporter periplasmic adaptor subunit [Candidatus Latescibacterota bacterium]
MKKLFILLSIFIIFWGCGSPDTQMDVNVEVPVSVEEVSLKPIEEFVVTTGTVTANQTVELNSETAGFYRLAINPATSQPFALGDHVKKGQAIIYLDNPEQENSIRIDSQTLNLDISKRVFDNQQSLFEKGGVTLSDLKNAERSYIDAQYSYDNALIQLSKMKITSTFDGIIVDLFYYTEGIKVPSGSDMVHIMDYKKLNMEINIPGNLLGQVKVNQPVRIMNYTVPDNVLNGKITQLSPALQPETRSFKGTVIVDNPDLILRPGMFVKTEIIIARQDSTVVIPKEIILSRRNRKTVFVVERGNAIERRIDTGLENPEESEVVEGLNPGDRLVVEGFETLRSGSRVKITN